MASFIINEGVCGHRPMAYGSDLSETSEKIFSGLSQSYDTVLDYATLLQDRRWKEWVMKEAGLRRGAGVRVLDVGCGTCVLEERMPEDLDLVALDLSPEMLRVGQHKRVAGSNSLLLSDAQHLPFADSSFDAMVSCYVVKYCDARKFVLEALRVLRPGGRLVLYDFVRPRGSLWPANALYTYGGLRIAGRFLELKGAKSAYTFSKLPRIIETRPWEVGFAEMLDRAGFTEVRARLLTGGTAMGFSGTKETPGAKSGR